MSFKYILLLFTLFISSCGVKGPPRPPAGTQVPSYIDEYLVTDKDPLTEKLLKESELDKEVSEDKESIQEKAK